MATNVSGPLPDVTLKPFSKVEVTSDDPNAVITRLVIHYEADEPASFKLVGPFMLVPGPDA